MKYFSLVSITFLFFAGFLTCASAQAESKPTPYGVVEISEFTIRDGVEFPAEDIDGMMKALVENFNRSRRFEQIFLSTDPAAENAPARRLKITGEIVKYKKGSRATRYFVGFGMGKTKIIADVKIVDAETGETMMHQTVDGVVSIGVLGGDSDDAKGGLASDLIKSMTKKGLAGNKRKSS